MSVRRDEYGRYEWDEEEFQRRFVERKRKEAAEKKEREALAVKKVDPDQLSSLAPHVTFVDVNKGINKVKMIGENVPISKIGQFSCPICQLYFRNSTVYLRHLNSPEHNQKMGMSMKIAEVTDEQVMLRVQQWEDFYTQGKPVPPLYKESREMEILAIEEEDSSEN
ncbi:Zinc finger matrin-type protein 2 [Histomonas meleagridis]|uniref:Zinc finger matrin-type protein 2 n=1 Tax=Histomonas meleagridis TaxID=135588 RepID=UPI0035594D8E|nr:Zinc finger matrin-type protein 2 [Histomonas meleagridis]KAH0797527.1 Zinc finger matrin-type protein 2 [Histomonas meleagridis]